MRIFRLLLIALLMPLGVNGATVTGSLVDLTGSAIDMEITFRGLNPPGVSGASVVVPSSKRITSQGGQFTISLLQGNYQVISDRYNVYIAVPAGSASYAIQTLTPNMVTFGDVAGLSVNAITNLTGEVIAAGPGDVASVIATNAVTNVKIAAGVDAAKISGGSVSNSEFDTLNNATGELQAQIDLKQAAFTTGKGLTNVANILSNNIVAGANITISEGANGQLTITGAAGGGGSAPTNTIVSLSFPATSSGVVYSQDTSGTNTAVASGVTISGGNAILLGSTNVAGALAGKQDTGNYVTALTGDVTATGPGSVAATISADAIDETKVLDGSLLDADLGTDALTTRFDSGQFRTDSSLAQFAIEPGVTNAAGAAINFDWSYNSPTILRTTNSADQTITMINVPSLTARSKVWKVELIGDGTHTLALAVSGGSLVLRSGTFVNPPPSGLNEYLFQRVAGTNYYDVLRPAFSATQRVWGRNSSGAGDVEEVTLSQLLSWSGPNSLGDMLYYDGTNWVRLAVGSNGDQLYNTAGVPTWSPPASSSGFDFSVTALSTNATPSDIYTNSIAENTTVTLQAKVTGAGTTNSGAFDIMALVRRDTGGSASIIGTNNTVLIPAVPEASAYWTLSGNDALLQVIGITNNFYTWSAKGWYQTVFNGTNTYVPFTAGFSGTGDYLSRTLVPTGLTDGKAFTASFWLDMTGSDGVINNIISMRSSTSSRITIRRTAANVLNMVASSVTPTTILDATGSVTINSAGGWHHYFIAIDLANPANRHIYVDGTEDASVTWTTYTDDTIDMSMTSPSFGIAGTGAGGILLTGSLADLWFNDSYLNDPTLFISAGGRPISLGSDGSTPLGSAPVLYFSGTGSGSSWNNSASASTYTVNGAPSSPTPP